MIELLVVIAIVAVLAAVLLPALSKARERARVVLCASNVRQISIGVFLYTNENEQRIPPSGANILNMLKQASWQWSPTWRWGYGGYLGGSNIITSGSVYACPGFRATTSAAENKYDKNINRLLDNPIDEWLRAPYGSGSNKVWANYSLHSSTGDYYIKDYRFDKVFPTRQLMIAEADNAFANNDPFRTSSYDFAYHGPDFDSTMNLGMSDGSIVTVSDWADTNKWVWTSTYYYPHNERYDFGFWKSFKYGGREY